MRVKKSLELSPFSFICDTDFTVAMAPKIKHVASSSSAAAFEAQMGGPPKQEAPISGNKITSELVSAIEEV